ncbi:MAG: serine/threonine-protein kinase, partial [Planctomycetota bacterium]|nr:serine/threonine-protein kinase [Planctomycetota bacterium]
RDIKPDNVLFDEHGHAYLSDFGIAKAVGGKDTGLTVTGATPGSPAYMAPEQPRQSSLTGASDQYSLAAALYEALCGQPTHDGETAVDVLLKKQTQMPRPLEDLVPDVPQAVCDSIMRALERDPERRWPSCEAMVDAFRRSAPEASTPAAPPPPAPPPAPEPTPAPVAAPASGQTVTVGTTSSSSFGTKGHWVVFALLILIAPLGFFFWDRGDEGGADRGVETADTPIPEDGGAEPAPVPPIAERSAPKIGWGAEELVGAWVVDREALQQRIKTLRPRGKRPPRPSALRKDLEQALKASMSLVLSADGTFTMSMEGRDRRPPQTLTGTWQRVDDLVIFKPSAEGLPPAVKKPPAALQARVLNGRLAFIRRGFEVPLKKP